MTFQVKINDFWTKENKQEVLDNIFDLLIIPQKTTDRNVQNCTREEVFNDSSKFQYPRKKRAKPTSDLLLRVVL
jgi:hypothetical protein